MSVALHVNSVGQGPAVVVLHGLFGAGRNWLTVARKLGDRFTFHLTDLRNHGASPHAAGMSYIDMADDVEALIKRLGLDSAIVVGHSMGGKVAMTLALLRPDLVRRLINIDIAPVSYPDRFAEMIAAMRALDLAGIQRRADADRALADAIPEQSVRLFILQNLLFRDGRAAWRANLAALEDQMPLILGPLPVETTARYPHPTWFIRGALSDRVQDQHLPVISNWFPAHTIETVAGGGHWPHAEAPAAFLTLFERALTASGPAACG